MSNTRLKEREDLIRAAVRLEPVDRVPIVYQAEAFSPRFMGVPLERYANDPDAAVQTTLASWIAWPALTRSTPCRAA